MDLSRPLPLMPRCDTSAASSAACFTLLLCLGLQGPNVDYNIKRLPKKPAPARFGRRMSAAQKARATHICIDCGYIYCEETPFEELGADYRCPQCNAPPR